MNLKYFLPIFAFVAMEAGADNSTLDAAVGGELLELRWEMSLVVVAAQL